MDAGHTAAGQVLDITAPLVVLDAPGTQDYAGIKMCLLDTPGPNEAGEEGLKYQVGGGGGSLNWMLQVQYGQS